MDYDLAEILDSCLADIRAGRRTVEECLAAYPEHRDELRSLLPAVLAMASPPVRIDPARKLAARARFVDAIHARPTPPWWRQVFTALGPGYGAVRFGLASAFAVLLTATLLVTAALASQDAKPGDLLYPVRTVIEDVQVATAGPPEARARVRVAIAGQRLNEVERAIANDDTVTARRAAAGYEDALARAKAEIEQARVKPEAVPEIEQALENNVRRQEVATARARQLGAADTVETLERARERYIPQMHPATIDLNRVAQASVTPTTGSSQGGSPTAGPAPGATPGDVAAPTSGDVTVIDVTVTPTVAGQLTPQPTSGPASASPTPGGLRGVVNPREIAAGVTDEPTSGATPARPTVAALPGTPGIPAPEPAPIYFGPPVPPRPGATPVAGSDDAARGNATRGPAAPVDPSPAVIASDPRSVPTPRTQGAAADAARGAGTQPTPFRSDDDDSTRPPSIALNPSRPGIPPPVPAPALGGPGASPPAGPAGPSQALSPSQAAGASQAGPTQGYSMAGAATAAAAYAAGVTPTPVPTTASQATAAAAAAAAAAVLSGQGPPAVSTPTRTPTPTATAAPPTPTPTNQTGIIHSGGQPAGQSSSGSPGNPGTTIASGSSGGTLGAGSGAPPAGPNGGSSNSTGGSGSSSGPTAP